MNLELGLYQGAQVSQQLNLAPQLLQWLRLLQAPTTELRSIVRHEIETNPTLEMVEKGPPEEFDDEPSGLVSESLTEMEEQPLKFDDDTLDAKLKFLAEIDEDWRGDNEQFRGRGLSSKEDQQERHQFIMDSIESSCSLQDHLLLQLQALKLDEKMHQSVELVVGSLDQRGYLATPLRELATLHGESEERMEQALAVVHKLDPAGVGARDLCECLLLQLDERLPDQAVAARALRQHSGLLAGMQLKELMAAVDVGEVELKRALAVLIGLDPEPGRQFSNDRPQYITPDVTVYRMNGSFVAELNDVDIPRLRISDACKRLIEQKKLSSSDLSYLRRKIRSATFLIQGIGQRQETLSKVAREILRAQDEFLGKEEGELNPLTMAQVARRIGVHETTVSRALANKYMETPRGVFEMKHFFRTGYACADGTALTPDAVRRLIEDFVDRENPMVPLTDLQMSRILRKKGVKVARRTIAKYREELGIPSSKDRARAARLKYVKKQQTPVEEPVAQAV